MFSYLEKPDSSKGVEIMVSAFQQCCVAFCWRLSMGNRHTTSRILCQFMIHSLIRFNHKGFPASKQDAVYNARNGTCSTRWKEGVLRSLVQKNEWPTQCQPRPFYSQVQQPTPSSPCPILPASMNNQTTTSPLLNRPRCYAKSPTTQDACNLFQS